MSESFPQNPFGSRTAASLWDALEQLRSTFESRPAAAPRMARGDVRAAVLALLAEQPMHGYQLIHAIEERSGGSWKPSAGSVYPTLQLLADEGLITGEEEQGRKTYSLTEAGRESLEAEKPAPWESTDGAPRTNDHARLTALPKAGVDLAAAAAQVGRTGSAEQVEQAVAVLDDARRALYAILADA